MRRELLKKEIESIEATVCNGTSPSANAVLLECHTLAVGYEKYSLSESTIIPQYSDTF